MSKARKLLCWVISLTFISLASVARSEQRSVGVIIPLVGPYAHFGEAARIGLKIGTSQAEERQGGIRYIYEDSGYEAARAVTAYKKLVEQDKVATIIVLGSPPASAVIPLATAARIPVFAWTPSTKLTGERPGVVRLMSSATEQGQAMAAEFRKRGYTRVAYLAAENEFSQSVRDGFVASLGSETILLNEEFAPSEQDFRSFLTRA